MPELPEVETIRRGLQPNLVASTLTQVQIRRHDLRYPVPLDLADLLVGQKVLAIQRRSKYLIFELDRGAWLVHLGMSGRLRLYSSGSWDSGMLGRHDHAIFDFEGGSVLVFHDPRRFGALLYTDQPWAEHPRIAHLGPEPLDSDFDGQSIWRATRRGKQCAHAWVMQAQHVVGVGNIYAQESLFRAGIRPDRLVSTLSRKDCERWHEAIVDTLSHAIAHGGSTLRDYQTSSGEMGYFQQHHQVYGRQGQPCRTCRGQIQDWRLQGRRSCYCPHCQR